MSLLLLVVVDVCWARYLLSLSDLQVMVGRVKDNWKVSYHKGTSLLHVVDKFSISVQFDRYVVFWWSFPINYLSIIIFQLTFLKSFLFHVDFRTWKIWNQIVTLHCCCKYSFQYIFSYTFLLSVGAVDLLNDIMSMCTQRGTYISLTSDHYTNENTVRWRPQCGWLGHRWVCRAVDCGSKVCLFRRWAALIALSVRHFEL